MAVNSCINQSVFITVFITVNVGNHSSFLYTVSYMDKTKHKADRESGVSKNV